MSNDYTLHDQWSTRPSDERYSTLADMAQYLTAEAAQCRTISADTDMLRVVPTDHNGLGIVGKSGNPAIFTHWSLNQVCQVSSSPASYIRSLPATLAADCLNYGLKMAPRQNQQLYLRQKPANGEPAHLELRALTSIGYSRILSANIVRKLAELQQQYPDWTHPLAYQQGDFGSARTPVAGYAGDRDCYVIMQNESARIVDPADPSGEGLTRLIMLVNSEVGAKRFDLILGLCERICSNLIIWNYKQIASISMRHYGDKIKREWSRGIGTVFHDYANLSARDETAKLQAASVKQLGAKKEDVIDLLFRRDVATKQQLTDAYELAERNGRDPRTAWGAVHGLTRLSQQSPYADERIDLDKAASKVLDF